MPTCHSFPMTPRIERSHLALAALFPFPRPPCRVFYRTIPPTPAVVVTVVMVAKAALSHGMRDERDHSRNPVRTTGHPALQI